MTSNTDAQIPLANSFIPAAVIAGVPVDDVTMAETLDLIDAFVAVGRATGRSFQIATINVDFVVKAKSDLHVLRLLQRAELCLADGMPVLWHARAAGTPLRERVAGADLVPLIVERSQMTGSRVLLFGSAPGVAESAARILSDRYPGANVTGLSGPYVTDVREVGDEWIELIVSHRPDIICVALGNPKQERFIDEFRSRLGAPVLIGVGGTLDFIVGGRRRAPRWAQRVGLEWVYRAAQEPGRLGRRYVHDLFIFAPCLGRAALTRLRGGRNRHDSRVSVARERCRSVVDLAGRDLRGADDVARLVGIRRDDLRRGAHDTTLIGSTSRSVKTLEAAVVMDMFRIVGDMPMQIGEG